MNEKSGAGARPGQSSGRGAGGSWGGEAREALLAAARRGLRSGGRLHPAPAEPWHPGARATALRVGSAPGGPRGRARWAPWARCKWPGRLEAAGGRARRCPACLRVRLEGPAETHTFLGAAGTSVTTPLPDRNPRQAPGPLSPRTPGHFHSLGCFVNLFVQSRFSGGSRGAWGSARLHRRPHLVCVRGLPEPLPGGVFALSFSTRDAPGGPGAPAPHRLASLRVAGISCSLQDAAAGGFPHDSLLTPGFSQRPCSTLSRAGGPRGPMQRLGLLGAPCSFQRRAVGTPWGRRGLCRGPCGRPGWREKPASPSSCGRTRGTPAFGSAASGKPGARSSWGPGACPGPRRRRPSRPSHAL